MTSKLQQAKNEKLLKELARLSDNKRCAICTNMGTQYTCQPPNIFVCSACAGVLYHFPGFRVKSRSMGTYTTQEVQQMKEGGNAMFIKQYLAKWNSSTFPPPVDKNPKRTEEFIKQVLVDKVFYSDEPISKENNNKEVLSVKPRAVLSTTGTGSFKKQTTLPQPTSAQSPWEAFPAVKSAEINTSNSGQSTMTGTSGGGGNWAEFTTQTTTNVSTNNSAFDPFGTTGPDLTSPASAQLAPPPQSQESLWDPFQDKPAVQNQPQSAPVPSGWSNFETSSMAKDPATVNNGMKSTPESGDLDAQQTTMISANDGTRQKSTTPKSPALDPLPEEWFSVGNSAVSGATFGDPRTGVQGTVPQQQSFMMPTNQQQMQYPVYGARQNFQNPQPSSAFSYGHPNMSPPPSLGAFPSFSSTTTGQPPSAQSWNTVSKPSYTLQSQDSMKSYVSARVDDSAHHPLFQNLDMDMRAKAHSVAGVPIQTRGVFRGGPIPGNSNFARPDSTSAEIQHSFMQQQRNFEEASGNPFA